MDLPDEVRANPDSATVDSLAQHLKNRGVEEIRKTWLDLQELINSNTLVETLGGAGREPKSMRANPLHQPLLTIRPIDIEYEPLDAARAIARLNLALIKLSSISMNDWGESLRTSHPTHNIKSFYLDQTIWESSDLIVFKDTFGR